MKKEDLKLVILAVIMAVLLALPVWGRLQSDANNKTVQAFRVDSVQSFDAGDHIDVDSDGWLAFCCGDGCDVKLGSSGTTFTLNPGDVRVINTLGDDIYFVGACVVQLMR